MFNEITDPNVESKIFYFIDYWRDFLSSQSIEEELTHTITYNPVELFREFAEEISLKKLSNQDNKKFFINHINEFSGLTIESINYLKPTLTLIKQQFSKINKDYNFSYLLHLLKILNNFFYDHKLGINCVEELAITLTDNNQINDKTKQKIKVLTNLVIFELFNKKYSLKSVKQFIEDIFNTYEYKNGILYTNFPHNINIHSQHELKSQISQKNQEKIAKIIDNLTSEQRILSIKNYFTRKTKKLTYIFKIKGLKGNIDISLGDVRIYNPCNLKIIKQYFSENILEDNLSNNKNYIYCNGAVTLDVIDEKYARQEAVILLSQVLDIITTPYSKYSIPVSIDTNNILSCDQNGVQAGYSSTTQGETIDYDESIEINQIDSNLTYLQDFYQCISSDQTLIINKKILDSLHWKRKATESTNINEKILWYWISIENLFGNAKQVFDIVPKLLAVRTLYQFAWKHFHKLEDITQFGYMGFYRKFLQIPKELQEEIGLATEQIGQKIYLHNLISNITIIQNHLDKNELLSDQLDYLKNLFSDSERCLKLLDKFEEISLEKLIYSYRIRNKIVHDAGNKIASSADYYSKFICNVSHSLLLEFIDKRKNKEIKTVVDITNDIIYDFDKLKYEIKTNGTNILLTVI